MQAFGLRTHAWNTAWRSMLLLAGFPLLLAITMLGIGLIFGAEQHNLSRAFADALRNLPALYAVGCVVAAIWFAIAWKAHNAILDWATGAHPVTRLEEPRLWNLLENLCISRGMKMPRLAIIETPAMNAYAAGLSRETGSVTVTRGLLNGLDDRELAAVLAHELAHIRNGDARLGLIAAVFVGIISLGFDTMTRTRRVERHERRSRRDDDSGWQSRSDSRNSGRAALIGLLLIRAAHGAVAEPGIPCGCGGGGTHRRPGCDDLGAAQGRGQCRHAGGLATGAGAVPRGCLRQRAVVPDGDASADRGTGLGAGEVCRRARPRADGPRAGRGDTGLGAAGSDGRDGVPHARRGPRRDRTLVAGPGAGDAAGWGGRGWRQGPLPLGSARLIRRRAGASASARLCPAWSAPACRWPVLRPAAWPAPG